MKKTSMWLAAVCACLLLLSVAAVNAQAPASVGGPWTITMAPMEPPAGGGGGGGRGPQGPIVMTFKQDGSKLVGSMPGRNGGPDTVFEGSITGKDMTWTIKRTTQNGEIVTVYKASVDGDNMKGTATTGDRPPRDFTGVRGK